MVNRVQILSIIIWLESFQPFFIHEPAVALGL